MAQAENSVQDDEENTQKDVDFYSLNYHLRKYILGFIPFKQLKRLLYVSKQMNQDILNYFRTHLSKLTVNDTLRFENDGYQIFFKEFGKNLKNISIFCQGLNFTETLNCLPESQIERLKLIMCPSFWLQQRSFYRLLKLKFSKSLVSLQIQVYMQVQSNRNYNDYSIDKLNSENTISFSNFSSMFQSQSRNTVIHSMNHSRNTSTCIKPVSLPFLQAFWQSFKHLAKISMKEVQTDLDLSANYNLVLLSIFTSANVSLRVLKIQNMLIPISLISNENIQNNEAQNQFIQNNSWSEMNNNFNNNSNSIFAQQNLQQNNIQPSSNFSFQQQSNIQNENSHTNNQENSQSSNHQQVQNSNQLQLQNSNQFMNQNSFLSQNSNQYIQENSNQFLQNSQSILQNQAYYNSQHSQNSNNNSQFAQINRNLNQQTFINFGDEFDDEIEDTINFNEKAIINKQQIKVVSSFSKLEVLKIVSTRNSTSFLGINDSTLQTLIRLIPKTLKNLDILDCQNQTGQALKEKSFSENQFMEFIIKFNNLKKFSINCYKIQQHITNFALMYMVEAFSDLTCLGLASCNNINNGILNTLINKNSASLLELCMDYTQLDGALDILVQTGAQLKRLSINYCKRIKKEEIVNFCNHQNSLQYLSVKQVRCFTKKALVPLVHNNYKTLKSLILEGNKIDNTHIAYLLRYCKSLQSLAIRKMDKIHDNFSNSIFHNIEGFSQRENYSPVHEKITYLDISYNQTFNDSSISNISLLFPNLYTFILDSCSIRSLNSLLPLAGSINSLNLSKNLVIIKQEENFVEFCKVLQKFNYLNTIFIEIPNIDRFLKHSNFVWNSKPIIIKESFNVCCYPITRTQNLM